MKAITSILIFILSFTSLSCGLKTKSVDKVEAIDSILANDSNNFDIKNFRALPKTYAYGNRAYLIDKITPSTDYAYWECVYKDGLIENNRGSVIVYNGDTLRYSSIAKRINSDDGFFVECHPGICFSYIVGVRSNNIVDIIDSNDKLVNFIGHIDNIEEVILMAKLNGYWFDPDTIIGGAYLERENDYLLYLLDFMSTPVTYKSVRAILTKKGNFRKIDKIIYKQTDEYIIE